MIKSIPSCAIEKGANQQTEGIKENGKDTINLGIQRVKRMRMDNTGDDNSGTDDTDDNSGTDNADGDDDSGTQ